ncbi:MFS transporter [Hyunsoonleella flava]|uniref:MFS transporter n=1 Tax=Hyunsoonleella flava TaxID=2527939 RepID=A0A4Q9FIB0_9FLAO|nr:MFS transporter [Hyunsoonleella flava]TBN06741.1 MFS transporter [Hyunsoonleella flava]
MKTLFNNYLNTFKGLSTEVWWLALITLINRAGAMVLPFLSIYLNESLQLSFSDVGTVLAFFGFGAVTGSWLGGKLTDKIGYYKVMVRSLMSTGVLFILLQYLNTFFSVCLGVYLVITVADMFRPAMFVALSAYSKPENKTRSVTLVRLAINLGFTAGPAVAGLIVTLWSYSGLFWVDGITCILATLLMTLVLNPKKAKIQDDVKTENPQSVFKDKVFLVFLFAMFLFGVIFLQLLSTIPLYYRNGHYLSELEIGLLLGANGLLIFLLEMPLINWLENSKASKLGLILFGAILTTLSFLVFNVSSWSGVLIISMFLITVGEMIAFPFSNSFTYAQAKKGNLGEYMALYTVSFSLAHIFSHKVSMEMIVRFGFDNTWYIVTGIGGICVFLLFILKNYLRTKRKIA